MENLEYKQGDVVAAQEVMIIAAITPARNEKKLLYNPFPIKINGAQ
ncbi:MAG: hypothetical protein AAF378_02905 [Cyanobacteria bacterium P01_A01_bin.84]